MDAARPFAGVRPFTGVRPLAGVRPLDDARVEVRLAVDPERAPDFERLEDFDEDDRDGVLVATGVRVPHVAPAPLAEAEGTRAQPATHGSSSCPTPIQPSAPASVTADPEVPMPTSSIRRPAAAIGALVLAAALLLGACSSGSASSSSTTTTVVEFGAPGLPEFYGVPSPLPSAAPGTVIRSEPVTVAGLHGSMSRIMYHSTTIDGKDIAVTGLIAIPSTPAPSGGRPVVAWAHGTTGIADVCAPSLDPTGFGALANVLLDQGWVIVATDYEGMGTPGRHPYIAGNSEAHGVLDSVRVAQSFPGADASKRYAVWGHSQGGHAALFAGHDAATYAPELQLVSVVAGAPPSQLLLVNAALQNSPFKHYIALAAAGINAAYGDSRADLNQVLTSDGLAFLDLLDTTCSGDLAKAANGMDFSKVQKADPATIPAWADLLKANDPASFTAPIPVPLLMIHGGNDEQIPVASSALLFNQFCAIGQVEQRWVFDGQSHAGVIVPSIGDMTKWITDRFAGAPMPDPLQPTGAVVQSCGKS